MGIRIALAGNPNCGKTTLFNDLTGASQYVGNWPGVTVEKKEGKYSRDKDVIFTDLPGVYSLSPYSPEEIVTRDYLLGGEPDVVVNLVDATNLERNLYLTTQIVDLGVPVVIALNMMDLIEKSGTKINVKKLSDDLGVPVVEISALRKRGREELIEAAKKAAAEHTLPQPKLRFDAAVEEGLDKIKEVLKGKVPETSERWYSIKFFENEELSVDKIKLGANEKQAIDQVREQLEEALDDDAESIVTTERYDMITNAIGDSVKASTQGLSTTQKIDRVVTNRILGLPIFVLIMTLIYYIAVSSVGGVATEYFEEGVFGDGWHYSGGDEFEAAEEEFEGYEEQIDAYLAAAEEEGLDIDAVSEALEAEEPTAADEAIIANFMEEAEQAGVVGEVEDDEGGIELVTAAEFEEATEAEEPDPADYGTFLVGLPVILEGWLESIGTAEWLTSLLVDGIVEGVGAVLTFVPQMIILFLMLSFLEDCGYMARVAFVMDRIFRKFGLSGKSFIPMLISSGCAVPGIMATKAIENEKDRRMTIITTSFIPCGAKLPIIALVFGALAGGDAEGTWWIAPMFYFLGLAAIIISGIMLKKTKLFAGEATPFVMELPQYHLPALKSVLIHTWERVRSFIVKAGTIIFVAAIIIWFLLNFGFGEEGFGLLDMEEEIGSSLMAALGGLIAWIFAPLGFGSWEAAATSITGLVAKENVVSTVAIISSLAGAEEADASLWEAFGMLFASTPAIVAFCAFNLLCAPCFAAIGTIRRQMMSAKWTWFAIGYQTLFAWCIALMLYQFGGLLVGALSFNFWTVIAILVAAGILFQLFRPMPKPKIDKPSTAADGSAA